MRIGVIGGGPAGLYFALLAKKAHPEREITVFEKNEAHATFGWGVVFSEETLGSMRDADYPTYEEITDTFAEWTAIDVVYRGQTVRSRGHAFSAIARKRLLAILQRRCLDLGVRLRFAVEVLDPRELDDLDLIVGADGVHSRARDAGSNAFKPSLRVHNTRYAWFGTELAFDAFTFIFRHSPHGLFQVHAYPFEAGSSTFIVECHETTWRRAGLEDAGEDESIAFCEKLFADELRGRRLLSNKSAWTSFVTVTCQAWHAGKVVLLGDAAHTAHFTIGSGTKLAMEDAVALAGALERNPDMRSAFVDYELERQPVVERFQEAAAESSAYFENVDRYASFPPLQFAFNLLTRSGRITYVNLEWRDPQFVNAVDCGFAEATRASQPAHPLVVAPPPMFAPLKVAGEVFGNRVALWPASTDSAEEGMPDETHLRQLDRAAQGGAGLVLTEMTAVSAGGRITSGSAGIYLQEHVAAWRRMVEHLHSSSDSRLALQLGHAGRRGSTRPRAEGIDIPLEDGNWSLLSASPLRYAPWSQVPKEMDRTDMDAVREDFAKGAAGALAAGFDMIELDFAHGYLLGSFISPLSNRREDRYGGPLEARMRFPLEVLDTGRGAWPSKKALCAAISATDWAHGGLEVHDAVRLTRTLKEHGCDVVHVTAGHTTAEAKPLYGRLFLVRFSDRIRNEAGIPAIVGGNITTADEVNTVVAAGRADLCIMHARPGPSFDRYG